MKVSWGAIYEIHEILFVWRDFNSTDRWKWYYKQRILINRLQKYSASNFFIS